MQPRVDVKMGDAAEIKESKRTFIVPTIKSVDHYDFTRAKISCSLTWLIAKAFGSGRWRLTGWNIWILSAGGSCHKGYAVSQWFNTGFIKLGSGDHRGPQVGTWK